MAVICPNCGFRHADQPFAEEILTLPLPNCERRIRARLIAARGSFVANSTLVSVLYDDRPDGGPELDRQMVMSHVSRLRKKIRKLGWTISCRRLEGYRLERVAE